MNLKIKEVGRYMVAEQLGEGSFGKVYKGIDRLDQSEVALKFISKKGKKQKDFVGLRLENEMLKKLSHQNIIRLIDFVETKNEMIIVTDYAGQDLSELLKKNKRFSYEEVRNYSRQIFQALAYLNEHKITHRDLKPANILIKDGVIKICDFGFARKLSASTNFMNSLKGTPLYIAPEILDGRQYTHKVDIWSFGIIIYELFHGITPFHAQTIHQLKPKILGQKVQFPKDMPVDMKTLIGGMLQKNPVNRFDWPDLKKDSFFADPILSQQDQNASKPEKPKSIISSKELNKQNSEPLENVLGINSNVVHFIQDKDIQEIYQIEGDLLSNKINGKDLKINSQFYDKIMAIFSSYIVGENIVPKDVIYKAMFILNHLITKVKLTDAEQIARDITKKKDLLFCILKLSEQETDPVFLERQFMLIAFLLKINFSGVCIDFDTDQDITDLCLKWIQNPKTDSLFSSALKVMGTLGNQGIMTLAHSENFFLRIEEEKILTVIAEAFEPTEKKTIVLECLEMFLHPTMPSILESNSQLGKKFKSMKQQVAIVLLNRNILSANPLETYSERKLESYCKIIYQCLQNSDLFRKQFLKCDYWSEIIKNEKLRHYVLAYDFVCLSKEKVAVVPDEIMKNHYQGSSSYIQKAFLLARAGFKLSERQLGPDKIKHSQSLLNAFIDIIAEPEQTKLKASRSVEGYLSIGERIFEEAIASGLCYMLVGNGVYIRDLNSDLIVEVTEHLLNTSTSGKLQVSLKTTQRLVIALYEISKSEQSPLMKNYKFLTIIYNLFVYFLNSGLFFQLCEESEEYPAQITQQFFISMLTIVRNYEPIDEKKQFAAYCLAQDKGIHNLLVSQQIINKKLICLTLHFLLKVSTESKHTQEVIDFIGMNLVLKVKPFINSIVKQEEEGDSEILVLLLQALSLVMKKSQEYVGKIRDLDIIAALPQLLICGSENIKHQSLMFIGHLSKHSQYFFDDFYKWGIFPAIVDMIRKQPTSSTRVNRGLVYAIGNVSFYTERFKAEITELIPTLSESLNNHQDSHSVTNTISTVSNLLRHSNCYLKALIQNKVIKKVLQIVMDMKKADNKMMFGLNMIKKVLMYPEVFQDHPREQFIRIYREKHILVGQDNECMRKIKTLMTE